MNRYDIALGKKVEPEETLFKKSKSFIDAWKAYPVDKDFEAYYEAVADELKKSIQQEKGPVRDITADPEAVKKIDKVLDGEL
jgi:hypothetical protein